MTILKTFLLPLAAGMLFRTFSPGWAEKLGDPIMRYAGIVLLIGAAIIIVSSFRSNHGSRLAIHTCFCLDSRSWL